MYRTLLCLFAAILLNGCGIDYVGSTKYIFKGRIEDASGWPIPNIEVATFVSDGNTSDVIGYDRTDSDGNYTMIFPKARNVETSLYINSEFYGSHINPSYSGISIININQQEIDNYTINFGISTLYRNQDLISFRINLINLSNIPLVNLQVTGQLQESVVDYSAMLLDDSFNPEETYTNGYIPTEYMVAKNQTLILKYLLADGTISELNVPVGTENLTINLEY